MQKACCAFPEAGHGFSERRRNSALFVSSVSITPRHLHRLAQSKYANPLLLFPGCPLHGKQIKIVRAMDGKVAGAPRAVTDRILRIC